MYNILERGEAYMKIQLTGVSGSTYDVKINNVTKTNLAYNEIVKLTGLYPNTTYTIDVYKTPQTYSRIVIRGNGVDPLSLAEVRVYDYSDYLVSHYAPNIKSVRQSDTLGSAVAERAIDGNTSGDFGHGSVTHTNAGSNKYWLLEFNVPVTIKQVHIYNRTDDCCMDRLNGCTLELDQTAGNTIHTKTLNSSSLQKFTFDA